MPNGFSDAMRVFTKIHKPVYAYNQPLWMTDNIKMSLKQSCKLKIFFSQMVRGNLILIKFWKSLQNSRCYVLKITKKIADSDTASKTYWTILNRFFYNKRIPAIPRLLVDGEFVSDFCEKASIFNNLFAFIEH